MKRARGALEADDDLFAAFDDGVPVAAPTAAAGIAASPQSAGSSTLALPDAFAHLADEVIASLQVGGMADQDRIRLDEVFRVCAVAAPRGPPRDALAKGCREAAKGTVHYFRELHAL